MGEVVGFDNIELAGVLIPKLTTIGQPIKEIGIEAIRKLNKLIKKEQLDETHSLMPVTLVERETTKKGL